VGQLGANAHSEVLEAARDPDRYFGLLLDPAEDVEAVGVLVVAPLQSYPVVPQRDGTVLYELRQRLARQVWRARWRGGCTPPSGHRPDDGLL
jgi:hypothetical protein